MLSLGRTALQFETIDAKHSFFQSLFSVLLYTTVALSPYLFRLYSSSSDHLQSFPLVSYAFSLL